MDIKNVVNLLLAFALTLALKSHTEAQAQPSINRLESIGSVEEIKKSIARSLLMLEKCPTGGCQTSHRIAICELVGGLDVMVNGKIVGEMMTNDPNNFPISDRDLTLMRDIFSQCRPSNYQYWNFEFFLHVRYAPTNEMHKKIRSELGIPIVNLDRELSKFQSDA